MLKQAWSDRYPSVAVLRREVDALVESFVEALLARVPDDEVRGIYLKGSAKKEWASPVDYVPELSDVDIHVFFRDAADVERRLGSAAVGFEIQADVEQRYLGKVASPVHFPRPQLIMLNDLMQDPDCVLSPRETVTTLYGEDYPTDDHWDDERVRGLDRAALLAQADFLARFPLHIIDKPGAYLAGSLRGLNWRVSPMGPRVLAILGVPPRRAWVLSRSEIIPRLEELGEPGLAADYRDYYLGGWEYFLSGYRDSAAGRRAAACGIRVLERSIEVAERTAPRL